MDNDLVPGGCWVPGPMRLSPLRPPGGRSFQLVPCGRIEDKDTGGIEVTGAKTGYVVESGNCAASCGETADGRRYICVTADATAPGGPSMTMWRCTKPIVPRR